MEENDKDVRQPRHGWMIFLRILRYVSVLTVTAFLALLVIMEPGEYDYGTDLAFLFFVIALTPLWLIAAPIICIWICSLIKSITRHTRNDKILLCFHIIDLLLICWIAYRCSIPAPRSVEETDHTMPIDTSKVINQISNFEQDYQILPIIDSVSPNHSRIRPASDITEIPDSIAHIRYLYADETTRCEGWVVFFHDPEDDTSTPFGEWKYYDVQGNCYSKFWEYEIN